MQLKNQVVNIEIKKYKKSIEFGGRTNKIRHYLFQEKCSVLIVLG